MIIPVRICTAQQVTEFYQSRQDEVHDVLSYLIAACVELSLKPRANIQEENLKFSHVALDADSFATDEFASSMTVWLPDTARLRTDEVRLAGFIRDEIQSFTGMELLGGEVTVKRYDSRFDPLSAVEDMLREDAAAV